MTQTDAIFRMLRDRPEGITALDALNECGSFRLAARISDLRDDGHDIRTVTETTPHGKRIARYVLIPKDTLWAR